MRRMTAATLYEVVVPDFRYLVLCTLVRAPWVSQQADDCQAMHFCNYYLSLMLYNEIM